MLPSSSKYFFSIAVISLISWGAVPSRAAVTPRTYQERVHELYPTYDTFIRGLGQYHHRLDYTEIGNLFDFAKSRILIQFNVTEFVRETSWTTNEDGDLPMSTVVEATLKLFCVNVITSHSQNRYDQVFNDTVNVAKILVPWDVNNVTSVWRSGDEYWHTPYLATTGQDATPSLFRSQITIDFRSCSDSGDNAVLAISLTDVFREWLENPSENYGLLLWADDDDDDIGVVKFGSTENGLVGKHPRIDVLIKDFIDETGTCPPGQFYCIEGTCISNDKVCNFIPDCIHPTDEELCGVECDFEESTCNWEIISGENEWRHVRAIDAAVGPLRDHSEESEQGHYILFSSYDMQNSTLPALFISPNYTMSGPQCLLNFRYQLSGDAAESLSVYVRTGKQEAVAWSVKGDQQNRWLEASIQIGMLNEPFQVVMEGILDANTEDASYISVDSVSFLYCSPELPPLCSSQIVCRNEVCIGPDELCDINKDCLFGDDEDHDACAGMPESARCDFEDENMCGWFNEATDDDFDWKRHFGRTPTKNTGPSRDHTLGTDQGHYMYIEVSNPVQNGDKANFRSPVFPSPPADNWMSGDRYESCKLRFHYHIYGRLLGLLRVFAVQNDTAETTSRLWQSPYSANDDIWVKATIPITENVQDWYYIQFEASRGLHHEGDIAIDDVSLSPECFGIWPSRVTSPSPTSRATSSVTVKATSQITRLSPAFSGSTYTFITSEPPTPPTTNATQFIFTPCSAMGMNGPSQAQCNSAYMYSSVTVRVLQSLPYKGIQVWTVPTSAFYSISAKGGGGGTGVQNNGPSKGAKVEGVFYLEAGEKIYLLVGHRGAGACETTSAISKSYCDGSVSDSERSKIGPNGPSAGGGGGGGGGTFVFKRNETTGEKIPLLVAAGGGGLAFIGTPSLAGVNGRIDQPGNGTDGFSNPESDVSGGGGGWHDNTTYTHAGKSLSEGGQGGLACQLALREFRWETYGGFGGGGGACSSGGGGGGYTGGDAAPVKSSDINGKGGTSYVHESAQHVNLVSGENAGDGQVMMTIVPECLQDEQLSLDRTSCVKVDKTKSPGALISVNVLTAIVLIVFVFVVVILGIAIFLVKRRKHKKFDVTYDLTDYQLEQLRQTAVMDFNPNYVLVDGVSKLQDLNEVPRENLQLISALGHGAFGEVYKGTFQIPGKIQEISVAVKTLPELSTQQDELDFIMEALILTKFNHPNIVECVGVCFTQTPRFIVLELMQGGELRDFLRENRPTRDKETILKMVDLLNIAMDITKGCEYLETERFIHRDIAARNILLSSKGPDRIAKIGDFGMARNIYRNDYYRKGGKAMLPVKWMPPEAYLDGIFTSKTDVWSFGVLLWELMSLGYMPYPGMTNQEVMQYVAQGERMHPPRNCPMPVYRIMTQCWQDLPENRPPFKTIKERVGYCLQDPDVLETPLPLSAVSESDVKRQSTIIRPSNLKARAAIDTQQFRRPSDINTAPTSLNCSRDSVLGPANVHPGSASHDQLSAYHTPPQPDPGYIRLANSAGSLSKFPDSGVDETVLKDRDSDAVENGSCGTVTSERRAPSSADSELSANELTDLIKTKQATADSKTESTGQSEPNRTPLFTQHDCDIDPKSNDNYSGRKETTMSTSQSESSLNSSSSSPSRKLYYVQRDNGVEMVFDDEAESGCPV